MNKSLFFATGFNFIFLVCWAQSSINLAGANQTDIKSSAVSETRGKIGLDETITEQNQLPMHSVGTNTSIKLKEETDRLY